MESAKIINSYPKKIHLGAKERRELYEFMSTIHQNDDGWITIAYRPHKKGELKQGFIQYHCKGLEDTVDKLEEIIAYGFDTYQSHASFYMPKRSVATLWHINTLFVDIDCHHENMTFDLESTMYYLIHDYFGVKIPNPTYVVFTGRGIQLYWAIENAPKQALPLWQLLQNQLILELKTLEEDVKGINIDTKCCDIPRITRLPLSFNTKGQQQAKIVYRYEYRYTLTEILTEYYPQLEFVNQKKIKKELQEQEKSVKNLKRLYTALSIRCDRSQDLLRLLELRNGKMTNQRDKFIFYYIWTVIEKKSTLEDIENELSAINESFSEPLTEEEIRYKAQHVYYKFQNQELKKPNPTQYYHHFDRYIFKNETIIKDLEISEDEQQQMKTLIQTTEKYRRNNERRTPRNEKGQTKKQQEREVLFEKIIELKQEGWKNKEVSKLLKLSPKTLERYITMLRKAQRLG